MPPRWLTLIIVLFWLTTSAVFFRHEFWPYLEPNAPPPFAIDLLDEARNPVPARWQVLHNGDNVLTAQTLIEHRPSENDFILRAAFYPYKGPDRAAGRQSLMIERMTSEYRVNPEGQLLGLKAELAVHYQVALDKTKTALDIPVVAHVEGEVSNGTFVGRYEFEFQGIVKKGDLQPVPVSSQGSVLMPMHPVNHVRGLRPGQTWRIPVVDPLGDALSSVVPGGGGQDKSLSARVLREPTMVSWDGKEWECLVIEYTNDETSARTWVRREDGLVLRHEVTLSGDTWLMKRE